jgi:hypothetical protein
VWRSGYGVNEKAPQAVVVVLQSCGKKSRGKSAEMNKPGSE